MSGKLTELATGKLLEKFGAGNHKPGSGSASAFQGMLSAQLLRTVIDLTVEPKRRKFYARHVTELMKIKQEIESRIYPTLEALFQEDSEQFDKVIKLREQRDAEMNVTDGDLFEIAGLIDKNKKLVQVSKNFAKESKNFTAAHELGHSILHKQLVLHRDKSLDGSVIPRSREEMQADKFATYFLMPASLVQEVFEEIFEMPKFLINENTVLALGMRNINELRQRCQNIRGLARLLASAEHFAGKSFNSLANIFGVTVETMSIRLEELKLLEF